MVGLSLMLRNPLVGQTHPVKHHGDTKDSFISPTISGLYPAILEMVLRLSKLLAALWLAESIPCPGFSEDGVPELTIFSSVSKGQMLKRKSTAMMAYPAELGYLKRQMSSWLKVLRLFSSSRMLTCLRMPIGHLSIT
jgi:hypothetical protein